MHDQKPGPPRGEGRGGNLPLPPRPCTLWGALQRFCWKNKHIICHWGELHFSTFPGPCSEGDEAGGCPMWHVFWKGSTLGFKYLTRFKKCCQNAGNAISETQISKHFRGSMPSDPLDWRALQCVRIPPGDGRHFKNSPLVELLFTTPLLQHKSLCSWIDNSGSYILFYNRHSLTLHVLWF